jgi:hypothetical protein
MSDNDFRKCGNIDMMTDMVMLKLAEIADKEDQSQSATEGSKNSTHL